MDALHQRAGVYAALGEPLRLAIVDRLVPGDASPGELAELLGLPSNLLAHHLKVLQDAGVVRRVRSEGDRRRSYVQLRLDDPLVRAAVTVDARAPRCSLANRRVVFVCTANSARSQLAAASWNAISPIPATSAGTHPAPGVHPRALAAGHRHGLSMVSTGTAHFKEVVSDTDLVVAVCDSAYEELRPGGAELHWAIPDPVPTNTDAAFDEAFHDISRRVAHLAGTVSTQSANYDPLERS